MEKLTRIKHLYIFFLASYLTKADSDTCIWQNRAPCSAANAVNIYRLSWLLRRKSNCKIGEIICFYYLICIIRICNFYWFTIETLFAGFLLLILKYHCWFWYSTGIVYLHLGYPSCWKKYFYSHIPCKNGIRINSCLIFSFWSKILCRYHQLMIIEWYY